MRKHFGSDPAKLLAAIGPGIGSCCYEIGEEVEREFESQFTYWQELFEDVVDSGRCTRAIQCCSSTSALPDTAIPRFRVTSTW